VSAPFSTTIFITTWVRTCMGAQKHAKPELFTLLQQFGLGAFPLSPQRRASSIGGIERPPWWINHSRRDLIP
jgi:hypothetical protein